MSLYLELHTEEGSLETDDRLHCIATGQCVTDCQAAGAETCQCFKGKMHHVSLADFPADVPCSIYYCTDGYLL